MDRILLLDTLNFIHRSSIQFGKKDQEDDFTIVFQFFRSLRALIEDFQPHKVFLCLEGKNSFRKQLYADYKANRLIKHAAQLDTNQVYHQADLILDLCKLLPLQQVFADKYEADDVIATLAESLKDEEVVIISNDKDYKQLLQKGYQQLRLYDPFKKQFVQAPDYHFATFLSLHGDASDNIPSLMNEEAAIRCATDPEQLMDFTAWEEHRANYALNHQLVVLRLIPEEELQFVEYAVDYDGLRAEFERMEFKSFWKGNYWERFVETFERLR